MRARDAAATCATLRIIRRRYSKLADWAYVRECARATAGALPLIGNGDVVSFEQFHAHLADAPDLATIMLARGALIKPWIFTEARRPAGRAVKGCPGAHVKGQSGSLSFKDFFVHCWRPVLRVWVKP